MKILIIGLGSIAKKHVKAINEIVPNSDIYALRSSLNAVEIEGVKNVFSIEDCTDVTYDFVIISNPTSEHYNVIKLCSKLGVPMFIEKPLFSEINQNTEELIKEISTSSIKTYIACNLRFLESLSFLKSKIVHERVEEVNVYCGSYLPDWRPNVDFRTIYSANIEMGGGVHIDLIHELDYVYWFFGTPISTVSNFSNTSSLAISANDYANYLWKYAGFNVSIILNYYRKRAKREIEVVTNEAIYKVDLLKNTVYKDDEIIFEHPHTIQNTYLNQMKFFIEEVLEKNNTMNNIIEANKILQLCMQE